MALDINMKHVINNDRIPSTIQKSNNNKKTLCFFIELNRIELVNVMNSE